MSTIRDHSPARLCTRCKVVQFNDATFNKFNMKSTLGEQYLDFEAQNGGDDNEYRLDYDLDDSYPWLAELSKGAVSGCDFCAYLKAVLLSDEIRCRLDDRVFGWQDKELPISIDLYYRWGPWKSLESKGLNSLIVGLFFDTRGFQTFDDWNDLDMVIVLAVESVLNEEQTIHNDRCETWLRLSPSTQTNHLTPKKLEWMNTYLLDCQEGRHSEMCCPSTDRIDVDIFPTRLVDVRGAVPRLIYGSQVISSVSKGRLELPKYAALSYCWGTMSSKEGQLKTEIASEPKFLTEIPKSSMTKTIADAVQLTQALQIPYLWIDALCIIQDNINDWERESSRMGQVYANAFVTFCSLGPSCPSSFLKPQPLRIIIPFQSSLNSAVNGVYVLRYYTCRIAGTVAVTSGLSDVNNSRWLERGWTHQEFVMSPRLLIFGPSFVHFLCPSLTASENKQFTDAVFGQWQFLLRGVSTDRSELYDEWGASIVPIYSDKLFSKPEDVLPAISGLAKHFADATQDEYVVGLWKRDIVRGLMWSYCLSPGPPLMGLNKLLAQFNSPSFYIAPSWSWIGRRSVELDLYRRHDCQYRDFQPEIDIMVTVAIKGQNPFGRIGNAELRITSKVYTLPSTSNLSTTQDGAFWKLRLRDGTSISCTFDWRIPPKLAKLKGHFKLLVLGTVDWTVVRKRTMNRKISKSTGRQGINNSPPIPDHDVYGLLIHTARQKGKFHRIFVKWKQFVSSSEGEYTPPVPVA